MTDNKQIRIGVDATDYESNLQRIKSSADTLARDLIQSARAYSTSSKEVLSDIEDQIKAIERRNKLDEEFRRRKVVGRREAGEISPERAKSQLGEIGRESAEDKTQTQLLRELIQATKDTAREQIRTDRLGIERKLAASKTVDQLAPEGDEFQTLRETVQRGQLVDTKTEEMRESGVSQTFRRGVGDYGGMVAGATSEHELVGETALRGTRSLAAVGGAVGVAGAISMVGMMGVMRAIRASMPYEESLAESYAVTGQRHTGFGSDMWRYGYTMDQAVGERAAISRARGRDSEQGAIDSMILQRGLGLDQGSIVGLETVLRGDIGGGTARSSVQDAVRGMRATGMAQGEDLSLLPEYMQVLVEISQQQLQTLGEIDMGMNTRMVSAIAELDESFKNPQVLRSVVGSLYSGLQQSQSPQQQALQYSVLSGMGDMSMFEMEEMRADPFGEKSRQYLPRYLDALKQMSFGDDDMFFFNIMSQFGVDAPIARKIGEGHTKGDLNRIIEEGIEGEMGVGVEGRAETATGTLMESQARLTSSFQDVGLTITDRLDQITGLIGKFGDFSGNVKQGLQDWFDDISEDGLIRTTGESAVEIHEETRKQQENIREEIRQTNSWLKKVFLSLSLSERGRM